MAGLSVEARVKAHISTPYINADGRGPHGAYAKDTEDCMLDPHLYRELETERGLGGRATNKKESLVALFQNAEAGAVERTEKKSADIRAAEASRLVKANIAAEGEVAVLVEKRADARGAERESDANVHFMLYQQRNASERAQQAFDESLKPSAEAIVRDREESVSRRHRELLALRHQANTAQARAIQYDEARKDAALALGAEALEKKLSEVAAAERRELEEKAKAEYESIVSERARQTELRRIEEEIRMNHEVQSMLWAKSRDEAKAEAQRLSNMAKNAEEAVHEAEINTQSAISARSYSTMKSLHAKLEEMCRQLEGEIQRANRSGSCLNMLMLVAKERAVASGTAFKALCRVCDSTYAPTVYTPSVVPKPDRSIAASVGTQTIISEPIRPPSQQRGRRI